MTFQPFRLNFSQVNIQLNVINMQFITFSLIDIQINLINTQI
jgi:hypothetical protein